MNDFPIGIAGLARAFETKQLSALEATRFYLERIERYNPQLNAYITVTAESALQQARASGQRHAAGRTLGPLDGIPIALKDNIDVAGVVTSGGIAARRGQIAAEDAAVVEKLRAAGAVILGKTNMDEGALGATTNNAAYGRCHNPHRFDYTAGGSSGGSGTAVAAGLCAAALGTDTLGSVRIPAAYCGCYGFKPGCGLVSNRGVLALSWTLDHVGPLTPRAPDLVLMMEVLAGYDPLCSRSRQTPPALSQRFSVAPRIAYVEGLEQRVELQAEVRQAYTDALVQLEAMGWSLTGMTLDDYDFSRMRRAGLLISEAEAAVVHDEAITADADGYSPAFRQMLDWGRRQSAQKLAQAYHAVDRVKLMARRLFAEIDVLALPTAPQTAFAFTDDVPANQADLTGFANLACCPAVSLPLSGGATRLPTALQLIAAPGEDRLLLNVSRAWAQRQYRNGCQPDIKWRPASAADT